MGAPTIVTVWIMGVVHKTRRRGVVLNVKYLRKVLGVNVMDRI